MKIQTYQNCRYLGENRFSLDSLRVVDKVEAHKLKALHLSTHLLITNDEGIYCRKRSEDELRYAGLWTTTIGTHVELDSDYEDTLRRFLPGPVELEWIGEFRVEDEHENEVNGLYVCQVELNRLPQEFRNDRKIIKPDELETLIQFDKTTPHLREAYCLIK